MIEFQAVLPPLPSHSLFTMACTHEEPTIDNVVDLDLDKESTFKGDLSPLTRVAENPRRHSSTPSKCVLSFHAHRLVPEPTQLLDFDIPATKALLEQPSRASTLSRWARPHSLQLVPFLSNFIFKNLSTAISPPARHAPSERQEE
jgi:hypothetical protein